MTNKFEAQRVERHEALVAVSVVGLGIWSVLLFPSYPILLWGQHEVLQGLYVVLIHPHNDCRCDPVWVCQNMCCCWLDWKEEHQS